MFQKHILKVISHLTMFSMEIQNFYLINQNLYHPNWWASTQDILRCNILKLLLMLLRLESSRMIELVQESLQSSVNKWDMTLINHSQFWPQKTLTGEVSPKSLSGLLTDKQMPSYSMTKRLGSGMAMPPESSLIKLVSKTEKNGIWVQCMVSNGAISEQNMKLCILTTPMKV